MFPRFRRKVPTPKDETEPKTSTAWKLVGGATGQVAKLVVDAAGIAANMCPLPGVAAIPEALKLIQETMEEAKNNMEECKALSEKCADLAKAFKRHQELIDGTNMAAPVELTVCALWEVQDTLKRYAPYGPLKAMWNETIIKEQYAKCQRLLDWAIRSFEIESTLHNFFHNAAITKEQHDAFQRMREIKDHADYLYDLPADRIEVLKTDAKKVVADMEELNTKHDTQLKIAGVSFNRAEFNVVFKEMVECLNEIEAQTGTRPKVADLSAEVRKCEDRPRDGSHGSEIWLGQYRGKPVAVKCLRILMNGNNAERIAEFTRELKVWSQLPLHNHIQPLLGVTNNFRIACAYVSPWRQKGNIREFSKGVLRFNRFKLLAEAAAGLEFLHSKGIVHANLKASNILITDDETAVISDFQMSRMKEDSNATQVNYSRWLAPELLRGGDLITGPDGEQTVEEVEPSFKSDVWSFGMTILEVLVLNDPWRNEGFRRDAQVLHAVCSGKKPVRPSKTNAWFTDDVWNLLMDCWSDKPEDRPDITHVRKRLLEAAKVHEGRNLEKL